MLVTIIAWIVLGAIAGYLARLIMPGSQGLSVVGTIVLGIIGALVVGGITWLVTGNAAGPAGGGDVINIPSIILATIGAIIAIVVANFFTRSRGVA